MHDLAGLSGFLELGATIIGAAAAAIGLISRPLWSKLGKLEKRLDIHLTRIEEGVSEVRTRVGEQNGRIGKVETWCDMHENHDDERHREMMERRKELTFALDGLRDEIHDLRKEAR